MDVEEDMRRAGVTEEREARDRVRWSPMIHCRCALMTRCSYISQEMHVRLHFWYKCNLTCIRFQQGLLLQCTWNGNSVYHDDGLSQFNSEYLQNKNLKLKEVEVEL